MYARKLGVWILAAALALPLAGCWATAAGPGVPAVAPSTPPAQTASVPAPVATAAAPTNTPAAPSPTPGAPFDFEGGVVDGRGAGELEALLRGWGFAPSFGDGAWGDEDAYALSLFQRWADAEPTGELDGATRAALRAAWERYGGQTIPRERLPLEGAYIGVNAGHQRKADHGKEPLSPEPGSPKKSRVSSGTAGVATGVAEYKVNLIVALKLRDRLEALGARVLMARTGNDVSISNRERAILMNEAGVNICLILHCDGNNNGKKNGLHTLVPGERGYQAGDALAKSRALAAIVQEEMVGATGARDLGLNERTDLTSLNWAMMPVCLVEMGYMTNAAEDRKLNADEYQDRLAEGLANAARRYFEECGRVS